MNTSTPQIFSKDEWHQNNQRKYQQSDLSREGFFKVQQESKKLAKDKKFETECMQEEVTKSLAERAKEIFNLQKDLEKAIEDLTGEIKKLVIEKKRLEKALNETQLALVLSQECLDLRDQRVSSDLVHDQLQNQLHKEGNLNQAFQNCIEKTINETDEQISRNRQCKTELERDWSDKWEAYNIDTKCGHMKQNSVEEIAYYSGAQRIPNKWSSPQQWLSFTVERLCKAKDEFQKSIILRDKIDSHLKTGYQDLRSQADGVETEVAKRINETNDSLYRLKKHLELVLHDIADAEKLLMFLRKQISDKEGPLKKVQTRLHLRNERPNVELCEDRTHLSLIQESRELASTIKALQDQYAKVESSLSSLQTTRTNLEKEVATKENTLMIDKGRIQPLRRKFPSQHRLLGY